MKSKIGKFLRILRIQRDENLMEMAKKLGISTSYLSAIENGKRDVPNDLYTKVVNFYKLSLEDSKELEEAINLSLKNSVIDMSNLTDERKILSIRYARKIEHLSDEDLKKIKEILGEDD